MCETTRGKLAVRQAHLTRAAGQPGGSPRRLPGKRDAGPRLIMTAPGRSLARPAPPWRHRLRRSNVRDTRNPLLLRFPVEFLLRFAERRFLGLLFQDPPRKTRLQGGGQAPGTGRTNRPGRSPGGAARNGHAVHGRSMRPRAARPRRRLLCPAAIASAAPAAGCESDGHSLPAIAGTLPAGERSLGT